MTDLSYLSCPNPAQNQYKSIADMLRERREENPEREIIIQRFVGGGRRTLTYDELWNRSSYIAKYLITKGIRPGDSVAIIGPNSVEWVIGEVAIILTGAVAVNLYKTDESFAETLKVLKSTKSNALLLDPDSDEKYMSDMEAFFGSNESPNDKPTVLLLRKSTLSALPSLADVNLSADEEEMVSLPRIQPESSAFISVTSGSTGVPKMVEMTHLSLVNAPYLYLLRITNDRPVTTSYNDRPFSWVAGSVFLNILTGVSRVFVDTAMSMQKENILTIWDIIKDEQCANAFLLPYALLDILENIDAILKREYKLEAIFTGGQHISSHLTEICGKCTEKMFMGYGSTEMGAPSLIEITPKMDEGYVGPLLPGYEVKVIGDTDETLHRGYLGNILIRSQSIFKSYRSDPELNSEAFADGGWFRTGDVGIISAEGKLFLKGKSNDVIKRGGLKVLSSVVESAMSTLPEIREVVVIGVPDTRLFEEVCACYILKDGVNTTNVDLDEKCRVILGNHVLGKTPSYFLRFNSFPRLKNGKTDKIVLKRRAVERLNLI